MKEQLDKERLLKLVPSTDSEGNVNSEDHANFEAALSNIIETYVSEIEELK